MSSRSPTRRRGNVVSASDPSAEETEDVDAVIARNLWKHHRMLPPDSKFKHNWDNMMLLFVLYTCRHERGGRRARARGAQREAWRL